MRTTRKLRRNWNEIKNSLTADNKNIIAAMFSFMNFEIEIL